MESVFINDRVRDGDGAPVFDPGGGSGTLYSDLLTDKLYVWDGSAWQLVSGGGGGGSPGGLNTQVQYNNSSSFGGITGATSDGTTLTLVAPVLGTPASGNLSNCTAYPVASLSGLGTGVATALAVNVGTDGAFVVKAGALGTPSSGTLTNCTGLPVGGVSGLGTGVATALAVNVGTAGAFVVNGGALGTPSSGTLSSCTGLPISTGVSGLGTGVATALAVNTGSAGAFVILNGALGTPSSGTLSSCTGLPISTGVSGLGTGVATFLATPSSSNLASAVTDETGTAGNLVFSTAPALTGPVTITEAVGSSDLTLTGATQTTSQPVLNMTQTWNAAGVTFTAAKLNVTSTASATGSLLMDLQVSSVSKGSISKAGKLSLGSGNDLFSIDPAIGGFQANFATANGTEMTLQGGVFVGTSTFSLGWSDVVIKRDAADVWAQRRTTNPQKFRVYNTFTTVETAGEWFAIDWITTANVCNLQAVKGSSSGTARVLNISYGGTQASPVAAISVPITSGQVTFGGGLVSGGTINIDGNFQEFLEMTAPAAGAANTARLFAQDNGAGKTQLMVIFNTGAAQQVAIQP